MKIKLDINNKFKVNESIYKVYPDIKNKKLKIKLLKIRHIWFTGMYHGTHKKNYMGEIDNPTGVSYEATGNYFTSIPENSINNPEDPGIIYYFSTRNKAKEFIKYNEENIFQYIMGSELLKTFCKSEKLATSLNRHKEYLQLL